MKLQSIYKLLVFENKFLLLLVGILFLLPVNCVEPIAIKSNNIEDACFWKILDEESRDWVDSVYLSLTIEERIAQLFWIAVENPTNTLNYRKAITEAGKYKPGGILLFRMAPETALEVIDEFQEISNVPMLVSIDGEWGLAMRFPDVVSFPYAMTLGAIQNDSLIYQMGLKMAEQFRLCGIHVNMAPVADVNSNPENPVIGFRSFGENPENVARKSIAYMQGLQDGGVMAVGKHFPGHGDTSTDSHKTLPLVAHSRNRLDSMEIYPFRKMVDAGLWAIMTAHIEVPELDSVPGLPVSFSDKVIKGLLREEMGFKGLVITDALNMEGARVMGKPGERDALALAAGNDIIEFTEDLRDGINAVKDAIEIGLLTYDEIEEKCRRSLAFKYWLIERSAIVVEDEDSIDDIPSSKAVSIENIMELLNHSDVLDLNLQLYKSALTLLKNDEDVVSSFENDGFDGAFVVLGETSDLRRHLNRDFDCPVYQLPLNNIPLFNQRISEIEKYDRRVVIIANSRWGGIAANAAQMTTLGSIINEKTVVVFMGNPYHLANHEVLTSAPGLIMAYQNNEYAQLAVFRALTGNASFSGRLPVSIGDLFKAGDGIER